MLTVKSLNPDKRLSVILAVFFAEGVLPIFEKEFPEDKRPREAVEAAKAWIVNPCRETAYSAAAAAAYSADAAHAAAHAAHAAAAHAAHAAVTHAAVTHAADAANAVNAANAAHAADAAHAAAYYAAAADAAAHAAHAAVTHAAVTHAAAAYAEYTQNKSLYIHRKLLMLLPQILEYKIHSKNRFESAEEVFALLPRQSQQRFLFHIDCLR
jgi:hypothetical protein